MIDRINLARKLETFEEIWCPKVVAELNGQQVKVAKVQGEFAWHHHEREDEMFMVVKGSLVIELRDGKVTLGEGELCVVPRGVEHRPVARELAQILLFEPATTRNTGNIDDERTIEAGDLERI